MAALFLVLWVMGGFPAAVLSEVARAENPRIARAARIAFALLLAVDLLVAAVMFSVGADGPIAHMTRSFWWFVVFTAGIPLALLSGFGVRRAYKGWHRFVLALASLITAGLYLVFPLGFVPANQPLTGLGRFAHEHHVLGVAILLVPTLILLAAELGRRHEEVPEADPSGLDLRQRVRLIPKRNLLGGVLFVAVLVWMVGATGSDLFLGLAVLVAAFGVFLWRKDRLAMRSLRRDLGPPHV